MISTSLKANPIIVATCLLLGLIINLLSEEVWSRQHGSARLIANKLKMVENLSIRIEKEDAIIIPELRIELNKINKRIIEAQKLAKKRQWIQVDKVVTGVIRDLTVYRNIVNKMKNKNDCENNILRLKKTANSLKKILEDRDNQQLEDTKQIIKALSESLDAAESVNSKQVCKSLHGSIISAIASIENQYDNNTTIVELDLSTPEKCYYYDKNRYKTYSLLLERQLKTVAVNNQKKYEVLALMKDAQVAHSKSLLKVKMDNFEQAEMFQQKANVKLIKALRQLGVYISE